MNPNPLRLRAVGSLPPRRPLRTKAAICCCAAVAIAAVSIGCAQDEQQKQVNPADVPYVAAVEVDSLVATSDRVTLLEFCVPAGCFRCDEMRPQINALAEAEADRLTVRRVDLNAERQVAAQWGVRVCPTYVVVAGGREVGRAEYPTSADLIAALIPYPSTR